MNIYFRAWKVALEQVLQAEDTERGRQSFVDWPVELEGYLVFCVLQLWQMSWDSYYALKRNTDNDAHPTACLLLHALVEEFLAVVRDQGRSLHGSRYNSTLRYVQLAHTMSHWCMAMVISEDGPIGIFPDFSDETE